MGAPGLQEWPRSLLLDGHGLASPRHGDSLRDDRRPKSGRVLSVPCGCSGQRPEGRGGGLSGDPRRRTAEPRGGEGANGGDGGPLGPAVPEAGLGLPTTYNPSSAPRGRRCPGCCPPFGLRVATAQLRSRHFTCRPPFPHLPSGRPRMARDRHTLLGRFWEARLRVNSLTEPLLL